MTVNEIEPSDFTDVHLFPSDSEIVSSTQPGRVPVASLFADLSVNPA
jgi:hypothetical protein